jgi:hypothetical protein
MPEKLAEKTEIYFINPLLVADINSGVSVIFTENPE